MNDGDDLRKNNDEIDNYIEEDEPRKKLPSFLLLCLITTFGVMFALGLSFSAVKLMDSNETINTLISSLTGDDNQDKYIITYIENTGDYGDSKQKLNGSIHITSASFYDSTGGGNGVVTYFGGLLLTTKTTFESANSKVTYKITIKNDSSVSKTFDQLFYNTEGDIKYTISGIKKGDIIGSGKSVDVYLTLEYQGKSDEFPKTIESSSSFNFDEEKGTIHITEADVYKTVDNASGKVLYFGGMLLTTENAFNSKTGAITYKITIKNDSNETKTYTGINYNTNGDLKYTVSGISEGDYFRPGDSKVVYLIVEYIGKDDLPKTIESSVNFEFNNFGVSSENGIYLINQFPTKDEIGKLFQGKNYTYAFSLLLGKKTAGAYYELTAVPNKTNTLNPSYIKFYLEKNGQGVDMSYRNNGRVKVFTDYKASDNPGTEGVLIYKDYITADDINRGKIDFVMRMWVTEDLVLTEDLWQEYFNKVFSVKVNTYAMYKDK